MPVSSSGGPHGRAVDNLSAYLDDQLPPAERAEIEVHLADCPSCQAELETLRRTVDLLRAMPQLPAPRSFTLDPSMGPPRPLRLVYSRRFYTLRQATGALAALFVAVLAMSLVAGPSAVLLPREAASSTLSSGGAPPWTAPQAAPAAARASSAESAKAPHAPPASAAKSAAAAPRPPAAAAAPSSAPAAAPTSAPAVNPAAPPAAAPAPVAPPADLTQRDVAPSPPPASATAPRPPQELGPPLLAYLAGALGVGLLASGVTWALVWLSERPSGGGR